MQKTNKIINSAGQIRPISAEKNTAEKLCRKLILQKKNTAENCAEKQTEKKHSRKTDTEKKKNTAEKLCRKTDCRKIHLFFVLITTLLIFSTNGRSVY